MISEAPAANRAAALLDERDPGRRWDRLAQAMADIGLDMLNYGFIDAASFQAMKVEGDLAHTTMSTDFVTYYAERGYAGSDAMVHYLLAGGTRPVVYDVSRHVVDRDHAGDVMQAGLKGGLFVPLPGAPGTSTAAAGITLGSSLPVEEMRRIVDERAQELMALAHLFHAKAAGDYLTNKYGMARLTERERDCLQWTARGERISAVAHRLGLAEVTVTLHLRNARRKLGARSLPEAVARGLMFRQIEMG